MAVVQSAFHAHYSAAYPSQGQKSLCLEFHSPLAGLTREQACRLAEKNTGSMSAASPKPTASRKTARRTLLHFMHSHNWTQKVIFHQRAGTAELGYPPYRCDRDYTTAHMSTTDWSPLSLCNTRKIGLPP